MPLKTQLAEAPTVNLTPMIDIVFLLIIFFMVATKFTEMERTVHLRVPEVSGGAALTPAPAKRIVQIRRDGSLALDRRPITLDELVHTLTAARRQYADLGILVRGDAQVRYQRVADVLAACKRAGIAELGIAVRLARKGRSAAGGI